MSGDTAERPRFLALTGPTASGKTALSLSVAEHLGGEIISADSRQVYRHMDVGTAKATPAERTRVPHHGLDLVEPDERYSAGRFAREARAWMESIVSRGRIPFLVGGTGFFLKALLEPMFAEPELDEARHTALRDFLQRQPRARLERWVRHLDPERAPLAVEGGPQRMGRTIEVALLSGRPLSAWHRAAPPEGEALQAVVVVLELPREEMDRRIDRRVLSMIDAGLVAEVEGLLSKGLGPDAPGMTAVGYREIVKHLGGQCTLDQAVEEIRSSTRRYARRQLTWFRNQLPPHTVRVDALLPLGEQIRTVVEVWRNR